MNYFLLSFNLLEKLRYGAKAIKRYRPSGTPCDRPMQEDSANEEVKE